MILVITGKSASGKDTLQNELIKSYGFKRLLSSTDRPIRDGEENGKEYNFRTKEEFTEMIKNNQFLEHREYITSVNGVQDVWRYGFEKVADLDKTKNYVAILDLKGASRVINEYGRSNVLPIYLSVDDKIREERCKLRGDFNKSEWERRLKADECDFAISNIQKLDPIILSGHYTVDKNIEEIIKYIQERKEVNHKSLHNKKHKKELEMEL